MKNQEKRELNYKENLPTAEFTSIRKSLVTIDTLTVARVKSLVNNINLIGA
jgi:hypothetical protein